MSRVLSSILALTILLTLTPALASAQSRTSVGVMGGVGLPVGWWGERWGMLQTGEINLRYEFSRGRGLLLFTGVSKSYFSEMSEEEVKEESQFNDTPSEYEAYASTDRAYQDGSFKQLPLGFGFYQEGLVGGLRTYVSGAMAVHLWRFERSQVFERTVSPPSSDTLQQVDNWFDEQDGSNVGFQLAVGVLYPLRRNFFLDASLAYHLASVSKDNAAAAYWGRPARKWDAARKADASPRADFILLRLGFRFGG